jgi:ABC-type Fe3+/spermidine/putrescine transport system ATPase subunit
MAKLELINIEKKFQGNKKIHDEDVFTMANINLTINSGEFLSVLGASGCGKTTLLKLMTGLIKPDKGIILEDGKDITQMPVHKKNYAMVAQQPLLFPNMTLMDNICFGLKMKNVNKAQRIAAASIMINKLKLQGLGNRYPSQLSGGQSQRGAIARALVSNPKVLFMDEPFSALNEELRTEMKEIIKELHRNSNLTIIFVTHDKDEAYFLSDRVITMKNGGIE